MDKRYVISNQHITEEEPEIDKREFPTEEDAWKALIKMVLKETEITLLEDNPESFSCRVYRDDRTIILDEGTDNETIYSVGTLERDFQDYEEEKE